MMLVRCKHVSTRFKLEFATRLLKYLGIQLDIFQGERVWRINSCQGVGDDGGRKTEMDMAGFTVCKGDHGNGFVIIGPLHVKEGLMVR